MLHARRLAVAAAAVALAAPLHAQSLFEGVVTFTMKGKTDTHPDTMVQTSKGSKVKLEIRGGRNGGGYVVYDLTTRMMMMVMNDQKQYMSMPMPTPPAETQRTVKDIKITRTGRHETVAGVSCEVITSTWGDQSGNVKEGGGCFAKGVGLEFPDLYNAGAKGSSGNAELDAFRDLQKEGLRIVKAWSVDKNNQQSMFEAVKIERKSVDGSTFDPPAGYKQLQMPAMPKGMKP